MFDTLNEPAPVMVVCPRCELTLEATDRALRAFCVVCRRGDLDAGRAVPSPIESDGGVVHVCSRVG